ncbi:unnamed protein product [Parnassius mnemosyne]
MPWMGVLIYKPDNHSLEEVTNIVMVEQQIAIGNAKDIAAVDEDSLKTFAKAMFYTTEGNQWFCGILGYKLHPEFKQGSLNTIAILYLDSATDPYLWKPIKLMVKNEKISKWSNVFSVGYTDRDMVLKQEMFALEYVSRTTCEEFYIKEEINFDYLWPTNALCYKVLSARKTCVNDAGMVLASNLTDGWVLTGLSTQGPGCSLPARYINIFPYVNWIGESTGATKVTRRSSYYKGAIDPFAPGYKSFIDMFFNKIKKPHISPVLPELANKTELVYGCGYYANQETIIYQETVIINTKNPLGVGVFAMLLFDNNFKAVSCLKLYTLCKAKSANTGYSYQRPHNSQAQLFAKSYPARIREKVRHNSYLMITDAAHKNVTTFHFEFKFQYDRMAMFNLSFYGDYNGTQS